MASGTERSIKPIAIGKCLMLETSFKKRSGPGRIVNKGKQAPAIECGCTSRGWPDSAVKLTELDA